MGADGATSSVCPARSATISALEESKRLLDLVAHTIKGKTTAPNNPRTVRAGPRRFKKA